MKTSKIFSILLLCHLITVGILAGCTKSPPKKPSEAEAKPVKVFKIQENQGKLIRTLPGKVHPNQRVDLAFQVSGKLTEFPVKEGMAVKAKQLIAELDPRDYEINVSNMKAKYENARSLLARYKKLLKDGYVSEADYEQKKMEMEVAKANLEKAKKDLSDTELYAPFAGLIAKKHVDNYQYVQGKTPIVSLQDNTDIEIKIDISEQDLAQTGGLGSLSERVQNKSTVGYVSFPAISGKEYEVSLKQFTTEASFKTQTYLFTLAMPVPEGVTILPGMTALTRFVGKTSYLGIQIPLSATSIDANGKYFVWIIDQKTFKTKKKIVKVGEIAGSKIQILEGLQAEDILVAAGVNQVEEGMKVRPLPENTSNSP